MNAHEPVDGRRARRQRSREAVIEAVFALVSEGKVPPSADDVAARAGVSVSSIFRNFDGLHDLQRQALERSQANFAHLFVVADADEQRTVRIRSHVRARIELLEAASGLLRIGRSRALDHEPLVEGLARLRGRLADQTRQRFAAEIDQLTPAEAANLVALIDATTSPEAFDLMCAAHSRTSRQIAKTWIRALDALFARWVPETEEQT
ncbi:TetR/AcrR family transcriptional regulator [Ilumatobacter sp.]|uniref:TetR/AcrR family transcriptional regulator n=1 Tax=Ilumatobacter sp. TaxID=1967498 RepID=UPI003C517C98